MKCLFKGIVKLIDKYVYQINPQPCFLIKISRCFVASGCV